MTNIFFIFYDLLVSAKGTSNGAENKKNVMDGSIFCVVRFSSILLSSLVPALSVLIHTVLHQSSLVRDERELKGLGEEELSTYLYYYTIGFCRAVLWSWC